MLKTSAFLEKYCLVDDIALELLAFDYWKLQSRSQML